MKYNQIDIWTANLGFLPVHLFSQNSLQRYLMLDGGVSDFCLDITGSVELNTNVIYSNSWSSNTKNYVSLIGDELIIFNWINKRADRIKIQDIRFDRLNKQLINSSFATETDFIPFVMRIFRQLRNLTQEKGEPLKALNLLYRLLISLNNEENYINPNTDKWLVPDVKMPNKFEVFVREINEGVNQLKPNLDLVLRHCAGPLFQEAHREVLYFDSQMDIFNIIPSRMKYSNQKYDSVHYTPQYIARSIVERCIANVNLGQSDLWILDPACGSGTFLIEALKQLDEKQYKGTLHIKGYDTSESALSTTRFLLQYEKATTWRNKLQYEITKVEDSLNLDWGFYDIILMNPPFSSWDLLDSSMRETVATTLNNVVKKGKKNQAAAFFYKATQHVKSNGYIGALLPSSIFNSETYRDMRHAILEDYSIVQIARLGNYIFDEALADVSFVILQRKKKYNDIDVDIALPQVIWCKNQQGVASQAMRELRKANYANVYSADTSNCSIYQPYRFPLTDKNWVVLSNAEYNFIKHANIWIENGSLSTVNSIFYVRQGLITGKQNIFEISESQYKQLPRTEQKYFRPVITSKSISQGKVEINQYIWYPYDKNGLNLKTEEEALNISWVHNYLSNFKEILSKRKSKVNWWEILVPRSWQYAETPSPLVSGRFGSSRSFGLHFGKFVIEDGNSFIFRTKKNNDNDYYFYLSCFSSDTFDKLLSIYAKHLLAGYDMGSSQISQIPIPALNDDVRETELYKKMVNLGIELAGGNTLVLDIINDCVKSYYPRV